MVHLLDVVMEKIPSTDASDLLVSLDSGKVNRAVIMSMAYMAGMPGLKISTDAQKQLVRHENEYVAKEGFQKDYKFNISRICIL